MIKNLIKWWPVIKEDSDWDWGFLLKILEFKLNKMADAFESEKAMSVGSGIHAKEMKEAAALCRKLIEDAFFDSKLWDKWHSNLTGDIEKDLNPFVFFNEDQEKEYQKDMKELNEKETRDQQETLDQLCEILKTKLFEWWD